MTETQRIGWLRILGLNIVASLFSSGVVVAIGFYYASQSLASMIRNGVEILNVDKASKSLDEIIESCRRASIVLGERKERPATAMIDNLRAGFAELSEGIDRVKKTEMYSAAEIKSLASMMYLHDDEKAIIDKHLGKPKRIVEGLPRLKPNLVRIQQLLEDLDRQLDQEPTIDIDALRTILSSVETLASTAQAGLESRQAATLETLARFDSAKRREPKAND